MSKNMWEVNEEDVNKRMLVEYDKTKKDLLEYIQILSKWADGQNHFPEKPSDRLFRAMILTNKFSIEKAKKRLDMYYSIRTLIPEACRCEPLSPRMIMHSKVFYNIPLPKTTWDLKRVVYIKMNPAYGPEHFVHAEILENMVNTGELLILDDDCFNYHVILDCEGVKSGHFMKFSPMVVKKSVIILEEVFGNRCASFYLVNFAPFMENVFNTIIFPMLSPKIRKRLKIHSGTDILLKDFGKEIMPSDIGGEEKSLAELHEMLLKKYEEHIDRFENLRKLKVDESLRPEKLINDDVLGYHGNFKKLSID